MVLTICYYVPRNKDVLCNCLLQEICHYLPMYDSKSEQSILCCSENNFALKKINFSPCVKGYNNICSVIWFVW